MTLASATNKWTYIGNGTTGTFSYTTKIFVDADLEVTVKDSDDVETTLTLTTDYTVTGAGSVDGGTIVLVDAGQAWLDAEGDLDTGYTIVIRRVRSIVQNTDIRNGGAFYRESIEDEFDKQIMIDQQQQEEIDRSIKIAVTSSATPVLPDPQDGYVPQWDGNDGDMINVPYSGDAITTAVSEAEAAQAAAEVAQTAAELAETNAETAETNAETAVAQINAEIHDTDNDTKVQCEESADEDIIRFDAAGTQEVQIDANGLTLKTGASVNEFSIDGTLAGDSDDAVPTEKAVKAYADALGLSAYVGSFSRDLTTATGTQAITGVGFTPKAVIFMGVVPSTTKGGFGFMTSGEKGTFSFDVGGVSGQYEARADLVMKIYDGAAFQSFLKSSLDADGFTLSWTKDGSPTGTVTIIYLALK